MNSFNFQIVPVANLAAIVTPFPDHICYFTEDTENYYIWENDALKEIFVDASSITWSNITNKPTTITGFGITDAVKVNNGTLNYLAKFTPDGNTIGNSQIIDDGSNIGIGSVIESNIKIKSSATTPIGFRMIQSSNNLTNIGIQGFSNGVTNGSNTGVYGTANASLGSNVGVFGTSYGAADTNAGIQGSSTGASKNYGIYGTAEGPTGINIGGYFSSLNGSSNYSVQLQDGTETVVGRYLRNMTGNGRANWANINITEVTNGLSSTLLGAPNGIATLDNNSKLVISQMPISVMDYKGTYDIVTNTPTLVDGTGNQGDVYVCTTAGTRTFGTGNTLTVSVGDWLIYNGTKWEKTLGNNVGSGTVSSVGLSIGAAGNDINVSNSPITSSGNINLNIPTASSTARGLLSTGDWTTFNDKIGGIGQASFVPRFFDSKTIYSGVIQDDGTNVGIRFAPNPIAALFVNGLNNTHAIYASSTTSGNGKTVIHGSGQGAGPGENIGVMGSAYNAQGSCTAVNGYADGSNTSTGSIIGGHFKATKSLNNSKNYSVQLEDGSEGIGKFLKSVTLDGKANWATITAADVSGAVGAVNGTNNYVAKFTPNGTTIGNSQIQDDGSRLCINGNINSNALLSITGKSGDAYTMAVSASSPGIAIQSFATIAGTGSNTGLYASGASATVINKGIYSVAQGVSGTSTTIGVHSYASGGLNNYSVQLQDGTEAVGKFLKSVTAEGRANWNYLPDTAQLMCSDMTTGITANTTIAKAYWVAPCNGKLTDIFSNLYSPQAGGSAFTIRINMNGAQIATLTHTNGQFQSTPVTVSNTFTKGVMFEVFVTQIGDGSAKGLLTTINYERT